MSFDLILSNVQKQVALDEKEQAYFISLFSRKKLEKKTLILEEGQRCRNINFVEAGTLRAFHINKDGKESTIMFAMADWWITDIYSFVNEKPALVNIEALEKSTILQLDFRQLEKLYEVVPKFERVFRVLMQNAYIREQLRALDNISLKAEERYQKFIKKYPQLVSKVTQKQIASYLGITPEFLSAIKKKIVS